MLSFNWQKCAVKWKILARLRSLSVDTDGATLSPTRNQTNQRHLGCISCQTVLSFFTFLKQHRFKVTLRWMGAKIIQDNKLLGEPTGPCYTLDCSEDLKFHRRKTNTAALAKHTMSCVLGKHPHQKTQERGTVSSYLYVCLCADDLQCVLFLCLSLHHMMCDLCFSSLDNFLVRFHRASLEGLFHAWNIRDARMKTELEFPASKEVSHSSVFTPLRSFIRVGCIPVRSVTELCPCSISHPYLFMSS